MLKRIDVERSVRHAENKKKKREEHYRPTALAVITDEDDRLLMVLSKSSKTWGPVKGGPHDRDKRRLMKILFREVKEEVGLHPEDFEDAGTYLGSFKERGFAGGAKQKKFAIGKHFHCVHLRLGGDPDRVRITDRHLVELEWVGTHRRLKAMPMTPIRLKLMLSIVEEIGLSWTKKKKK